MKKVLLWLIHFYQRFISPGRPPCCRFMPTCSAYALTAIERFGALRGGWMALRRICCCHPFYHGKRGIYDPVPEFENSRDLNQFSLASRIAPKASAIGFEVALPRKTNGEAKQADAAAGGEYPPPSGCEKREFSIEDEETQSK